MMVAKPKKPSGEIHVDPTANVLSLVEAAVKRLDDIANIREKYDDKVEDIRAKLRIAEIIRIEETTKISLDYMEKLSEAEAKRIDSIRLVDVSNIAIANERAVQQAQVLAHELSESRETLRTLIISSSSTAAAQLETAVKALTSRILVLEQSAYTGAGRQQLTEPMLNELAIETRNLKESRDEGSGVAKKSIVMGTLILGGIMALIALAGLVVTVVHVINSGP
jgi:hypothetical protein